LLEILFLLTIKLKAFMKKLILFFSLTLLTTISFAQNDNAMKSHYLKVFRNAMSYNDPDAAINALHGYIAIDSSVTYKDTLSLLYFVRKSYYSALILAEEVTKADKSNVDAYARAAECYQQLGDYKTSVNYFEQVSAATKNPYHYYQLAVSQYSLKRIAECEANCKKVLADTNSAKIGVTFNNGDGTEQLVPVSAAALNLAGVIQMEGKNYAEATKLFKQATTIFPNFVGAAQNLKVCEEKTGKAKSPATKPPATKPKS
jgi:tetratricopeptide (TPR) repeat protein